MICPQLREKLPIAARKGFSARAFDAKHVGKVKCAAQIGNAKNGKSARVLTKGRQAMTGNFLRLAATLAFAVATPSQAAAQESTNNVANTTDWSVFVDGTPKECWGVSKPKETVNTKDGAPVSVRRGEILLFVTYRAGGAQGEISFSGGYPFAGGSTVKLEVGSSAFDLFTDGEWAWAGSPEDDTAILAALKAGGSAKVTGRSGKGTQTEDTFSLLGFSAAVDEAAKRCAS